MIDLARIGAGLPVAAHAHPLRDGLATGRLVVQAPPGTGKTTFVPPLAAAVAEETGRPGRVIVTQPRRIAARAAARRLAALTGTRPGQFAGHTVRGESSTTRATRVEFVTTGVLLSRLLRDPELDGVSTVILDEVHERHLDSDLALAMVHDLAELREDLTVVAMSATLDADFWAGLLGSEEPAAVVEIGSVLHPLEVRWAPAAGSPTDARGVTRDFLGHLAEVTATAMHDLLSHPADGKAGEAGDVDRSAGTGGHPSALVFAPGGREVDAVVRGLSGRPDLAGVDVLALSGGMEARDQDRALTPSSRPRIVVSTSVAESSLTVPGVRLVVDSGLSREPRLDKGRGMTGLVTVRESKASAVQRAGRAARLGPGVAVRCLRAEDWAGMDEETPPEVRHADLVGPLLALACWGSPRGEGMALPTPLPVDRVAEAEEELRQLGAVDADGRATATGRALAQIPVDPRLARALLESAGSIGARHAAEVVAMLASDARAEEGDLVALLRSLRSGRHPAARAWRQQAARLEHLVTEGGSSRGARPLTDAHLSADPHPAADPHPSTDTVVATVVALAHPGWIARRRAEGSSGYLLACGTGADLPRGSRLAGSAWLAVAETTRSPGRSGSGALIRAAVPIDEGSAMAAARTLDHTQDTAVWRSGKVVGRREHRLGAIVLTSTPTRPRRALARPAVLEGLRSEGLGLDPARGHGMFVWSRNAVELRNRLGLLHRVMGDPWPGMDEETLVARAEEWLGPEIDALARGRSAGGVSMASALRRLLPWPAASRLDELVPEAVQVPTGSHIRLDYPPVDSDLAPVLAVKLQECFGWSHGPTVCDGRVKVVLHLLSPARRPLAVTDDLASFWRHAYPQVRAENRGRYIKHPWPEDPLSAPPRRGTTRSGR
ncbi:ATP-dependent helicase HrpB [Acidipropionibacterium jensenii]|uniref:ATP-dependent helicase HrpB n=1 Tax=Acidipropionibacterium jensenii TaxID=1749 RepID=UPI00110A9371|nr:ATP-dependent helicase HrpB [Acidipropionibacterium jensenii]QCV87556.1 ATP-dependent helicase HrpB [Acidipropionibacterium jensenii]